MKNQSNTLINSQTVLYLPKVCVRLSDCDCASLSRRHILSTSGSLQTVEEPHLYDVCTTCTCSKGSYGSYSTFNYYTTLHCSLVHYITKRQQTARNVLYCCRHHKECAEPRYTRPRSSLSIRTINGITSTQPIIWRVLGYSLDLFTASDCQVRSLHTYVRGYVQ